MIYNLKSLKDILRYVNGHSRSGRTLKYLRDYSRAVNRLTWQRQGIFLAVALLTGSFFSPIKACMFFVACMTCEYADLYFARKTLMIRKGDGKATRKLLVGFICNTVLSALSLSIYAVWIGLIENGTGQFTALFCLFAAAIYAALNNHQIAAALAVRLTFYGASFLIITTHDILLLRPPLGSMMWLPFFTVVFAMYFLIDCSVGFLKMYRKDIKRHQALKSEHEKTKAALVLKSEFVSIVSHELRTPLTSIKGSLDLVNSGKFGDVSPRIQNLLGLAGKNAQRLTDLVNDLLDIQKLEAGKLRFDRTRIELSEFLTDVMRCHQGISDRYKVIFIRQPDEEKPVYIDTDAGRLMQVIGNVLSNAAKFSPEGGKILIGYVSGETHVRISIEDQGIGIPSGVEDQIFARFIQLDSTNQRKFGGTGLGMNISRDIMNAIDGSISYTSELNVGTTFHIDVPLASNFSNSVTFSETNYDKSRQQSKAIMA